MRKKDGYKPWHGYLIGAILIVAIILGIVQRVTKSEEKRMAEPILAEVTCELAGGNWNSCGSACRTLPEGVPCIEVCVEMCECTDSNQCPFGYMCADYKDKIGVCLSS